MRRKTMSNTRITYEEALTLYDKDLFELGERANAIREKKHGKKTYFNINRHINPTNICQDICKFCAFSANRKNPNPYAMTLEEIVEVAKTADERGAKEIHIVSAHNPDVGLEWYFEMFSRIKEVLPHLHIKALTAAEIDFLSRKYELSYDEVIDKMLLHGVDSMPGGGAEIFDEKVRDFICKGKVSSDNWLEIHKKWHKKGKMSNATMLFGHVESRENRIDHMFRLRNLQDETGGFNTFIPLVYQKGNNYLNVTDFPTGQEILKTFAISRIVLDNFDHIKSYWVTTSMNLALVAQNFGADDLDGTIQKESINSAAGAKSSKGVELESFVHQIKDSGYTPVERDSLYNELKIW